MALEYSIHEAKKRFFEVIRHARAGRTVTVRDTGEPVAEIRPIERQPAPTLDERLSDLERDGVLIRPARPRQALEPVARRRGALWRLLAESD